VALTQSNMGMDDIYTEFIGTGPTGQAINLDDFHYPFGDPWLPTPHSGEISYNDMVGASGDTASLRLARSWDQDESGKARRGFQSYKGGLFQYATGESGSSVSAFGSISRNLYFSTGQKLVGFYIQAMIAGTTYVNRIYIVKRGSGNSGWNSIKVRYNNKTPVYGFLPVTDLTNNYWPNGTPASNYSYEIYRTSANEFGSIPGSYYAGSLAYFWRFDIAGSTSLTSIFRAIENASHTRPLNTSSGQIAIKMA
jgi:hypothetical protein